VHESDRALICSKHLTLSYGNEERKMMINISEGNLPSEKYQNPSLLGYEAECCPPEFSVLASAYLYRNSEKWNKMLVRSV
jgi:hypothetical protein